MLTEAFRKVNVAEMKGKIFRKTAKRPRTIGDKVRSICNAKVGGSQPLFFNNFTNKRYHVKSFSDIQPILNSINVQQDGEFVLAMVK